MPKSRGRRKPAKKSAQKTRRRLSSVPPGRDGYQVGPARSNMEAIVELLYSGTASPDLMVELLPPMLWLEEAAGHPANVCVCPAA